MRYMRRTSGYTKWDLKINCEILKELKTQPVLDYIVQYQSNWKHHLERMSNSRLPKAIYDYVPHGQRSVGRPGLRYTDISTFKPPMTGQFCSTVDSPKFDKTELKVQSNKGSGKLQIIENIITEECTQLSHFHTGSDILRYTVPGYIQPLFHIVAQFGYSLNNNAYGKSLAEIRTEMTEFKDDKDFYHGEVKLMAQCDRVHRVNACAFLSYLHLYSVSYLRKGSRKFNSHRNTDIQEKLKSRHHLQQEIGIEPISEYIQRYKDNWYQQINRTSITRDNVDEMSPGSSAENYPAFEGKLRKKSQPNTAHVVCPDTPPLFLQSCARDRMSLLTNYRGMG
ncbi:hypothetical protein ANN_17240 [Periplaneta americana]|uniref:Uncharacterized protein n=1 Tax=Periplaneta americana TaxID=6978 RepID=A0ABQ8STP6_PERAM|nr:hypothetical protein ANN_17240 [Periplaneta americana]